MKQDKVLQRETVEVEHCSTRKMCPVGNVCGIKQPGERTPLLPNILPAEKGDILWLSQRYERRVYIVRDGIFVCFAYCNEECDMPFALFGRGIGTGLAELYLPQRLSEPYYLRALFPGHICSLPAKPLKRRLEALPNHSGLKIMCYNFMSQFTSVLTQSRIISYKSLYDRVLLLFMSLKDLVERTGQDATRFGITHEEISKLVASERVSVTRVLHKMQDESLIELGYKTVTINFDAIQRAEPHGHPHTSFFAVGPDDESPRSPGNSAERDGVDTEKGHH